MVALSSGASHSALDSFTARDVNPGVPYWAGLSTLGVGGETVEVIEATPLSDDRVGEVEVLLGRQGIDGTPGATPNNSPGDGRVEGSPRPAVGFLLRPGEGPVVVYVRGELAQDADAGHIYGAVLTVEGQEGRSESFVVLSPVVLCGAGLPTAECESEEQLLRAVLDSTRDEGS